MKKLSILEVISKKPHWKTPPVPLGLNVYTLGLNVYTFVDSHGIWFQSNNISLFQAISSPHQVIFKHYRLNWMTIGQELPYSCVFFLDRVSQQVGNK